MTTVQPVCAEEANQSHWWAVEREHLDLESGRYLEDVRMQSIPTATGLKVREYLYQANYDAPNWEENLSKLVPSRFLMQIAKVSCPHPPRVLADSQVVAFEMDCTM